MLRLTAPAWRANERVPKLGGYGMVFHLAALLGETTTGSPGAKPLAPSLSKASSLAGVGHHPQGTVHTDENNW